MTTTLPTTPQFGLGLDCADPESLARFWSAAIGYANLGVAGSYVTLHPHHGNGPRSLLQRVSESKVAKNRMHLDTETAEIEREAAGLIGLGAQRVNDSTSSDRRDHLDPDGGPGGKRVLHLP